MPRIKNQVQPDSFLATLRPLSPLIAEVINASHPNSVVPPIRELLLRMRIFGTNKPDTCFVRFDDRLDQAYPMMQAIKEDKKLANELKHVICPPLQKLAAIYGVGSHAPMNGILSPDGCFDHMEPGTLVLKSKYPQVSYLEQVHQLPVGRRYALIDLNATAEKYIQQKGMLTQFLAFGEEFKDRPVILLDDSLGSGASKAILYRVFKYLKIPITNIHGISIVREAQRKILDFVKNNSYTS